LLSGQAEKAAIERAKQYANLYRCIYKLWHKEELLETIKQDLKNL